MRVIVVVEISFVLCRQIVYEVEKIGGLVLSVKFHIESSSAVRALPFPPADGGGARAGLGQVQW